MAPPMAASQRVSNQFRIRAGNAARGRNHGSRASSPARKQVDRHFPGPLRLFEHGQSVVASGRLFLRERAIGLVQFGLAANLEPSRRETRTAPVCSLSRFGASHTDILVGAAIVEQPLTAPPH